jgi:mycothiol synthase
LFHVRPARPEDYPLVSRIHNGQNEPDFHATPEALRSFDERAGARDPQHRRYVLEDDGRVIATGTISATWAGEQVPGRVWVLLHAREDARGAGADARILQHALAQLDTEPREVCTCIREDFVAAAAFLEPYGFEERFRSWGAHLHLASFDPAPHVARADELAAGGIRIASYDDLGRSPARDRALLELQRALEDDAPTFDPVVPRRHDDVTGPATIPQSVTVAATPDGAFVGVASIQGTPGRRHASAGFTGVAAAYRRRAVATALKARVAAVAKSLGFEELAAGGGSTRADLDIPIVRVNRALGFEIEPSWITFISRR